MDSSLFYSISCVAFHLLLHFGYSNCRSWKEMTKKEVPLKSHERLDRLEKENIDIIQSREVFSFSLDAVLLADFANIAKSRKATIVDLCSVMVRWHFYSAIKPKIILPLLKSKNSFGTWRCVPTNSTT